MTTERSRDQSKFITDCLPTYRMSAGGQRAIEGRYLDFASATRGLVPAHLDSHPSEGQIVAECISLESERILDQFVTAQPRLVITLGNAAARVMHHLAGLAGTAKLQRQTYGRPRDVVLRGSAARWFPLIHPAARDPWPSYHETWLDGGGFKPFL